jgi:hypothetical protein
MADDLKEFSKEEAQGLLFHGAPQPAVVEPSVQRASNIPVPPPVSIKSVEKGTPVAKAPDSLSLVKKVSEANKVLQGSMPAPKPPSAVNGLIDDLTANWKPLAIGAATGAAVYGASRLLKGNKTPETSAPTKRVEPTFATTEETATFKPIEQPAAPSKLAVESEAKFGVPLSDVENHFGVKVTNIKDAEILSNNYKNSLPTGTIPGIPSAANPMNQLTVQPPAPQLIQPKSAAPAPSLQQAVETGGDVGQALKTDVAKMVDEASKPVAPPLTKKEQGMKNWLLNQYGGKDLPMAHEAYDQVKQILGYTPAYQEGSKGGSLQPEEKGKILDWRKESLPGPKVNLTHDMKKILKVGGPALAALVATTEFANAKTAQDKASAGINMLNAILPPGADINAAGAPGVQQSQVSQAALLGSPYAQTKWAKNQRLRERAGAGRGIAPPSAYQR